MKIVRKLLFSIIALISVALTLGVSTYAWFENKTKVNIEGSRLEITGGLGFEISIDGKNFSNDLTTEQMKMAIVKASDPVKYDFDNGKLVTTADKELVSTTEIDRIFTDILLLSPVTSKDGITFSNLTGSEVPKSSGKFVEFDIWFKTTTNDPNHSSTYDIYLAGKENKIVDENGDIVVDESANPNRTGTKITSEKADITLIDEMTLFDRVTNQIVKKNATETIEVYTSNAIRLSAEDTTPEPEAGESQETLEKLPPIIYELTDSSDLGSYATDYNKQAQLGDPSKITEEDKLYNSNINAMFTYYNNLRPYSKLDKYLMSYENKPKTVRKLTDIDAEGNVIRSKNNPTILNLDARSELTRKKKITFRIWLEGWDADCFDGLNKSINVKLEFNSVRITV